MPTKILAVRTHYLSPSGEKRLSAVDYWRIQNPLKHLIGGDIEIDFVDKVVRGEETAEIDYERLAKTYDIFWTSYIDTPKGYSWVKAISERYNVRHIMDLDDNIFEVDAMNPAYIRYYPDSPHLKNASLIVQDVEYLTVSTDYLKQVVEQFRTKPVFVAPNYIDRKVYRYEPDKVPDNGDKIVIGYQGSATHHGDIFGTGFIWGLRRLMRKNKNVHFAIIGSAFDELSDYLPKDRIIYLSGKPDHGKWVEEWKELPFDIGVAPLKETSFNRAKSPIKYFEYGLRKIPAVYSFWGPYWYTVKENETGFLAQDEDEWEAKLEWLVESTVLRRKMGQAARDDVVKNYLIENHTQAWKNILSQVLSS